MSSAIRGSNPRQRTRRAIPQGSSEGPAKVFSYGPGNNGLAAPWRRLWSIANSKVAVVAKKRACRGDNTCFRIIHGDYCANIFKHCEQIFATKIAELFPGISSKNSENNSLYILEGFFWRDLSGKHFFWKGDPDIIPNRKSMLLPTPGSKIIVANTSVAPCAPTQHSLYSM